jgi:hypothetical protein
LQAARCRIQVGRERDRFRFCGDGPDAAWMLSAERNIDAIRALKINPPDHLVFSTWHSHPTKNLPETSPEAFTHLIDYYFGGR